MTVNFISIEDYCKSVQSEIDEKVYLTKNIANCLEYHTGTEITTDTAYGQFITEVAEIPQLTEKDKQNARLEEQIIKWKEDYIALENLKDNLLDEKDKQIEELKKENELIKNSDSLCKLIGEQKIQIEKMKFDVVKEAFRQGKVIQYNLDGEWVDWSEPTFDDETCNYRIKEN